MLNPDKNQDISPSKETKNWYKDRYETVITHRNFLAVIAVASLLLALVAAISALFLVQSKTVIPFLVQVDDASGATQILDPKSQDQISADESLRKYFVVKFMRAFEGYDSDEFDVNGNIVRLLAARPLYRQYWDRTVNSGNRESLYVTLGSDTIRQVVIKSVQFLDTNRAQVRFSVIQRKKFNPKPESEEHYVSLVTFEFTNLELTLNDMLINPLGFRVTGYKVDEDATP